MNKDSIYGKKSWKEIIWYRKEDTVYINWKVPPRGKSGLNPWAG